jgi:hypothetical protein
MPVSRRRPAERRKARKATWSQCRRDLRPPRRSVQISLETAFDDVNRHGTGLLGPKVLYHYTTWEAAEAIIRSQRFRASAHDCTNDETELIAADTLILASVRHLLESSRSVVARRVLRLFEESYPISRLGASRRAYLTCFSQQRDDPGQWRRYGDNGAGVCLGVRLFGIDDPRIAGVTTAIMPVSYGEEPLRRKLAPWFAQCGHLLEIAADIEHNWRLALSALNTSAAAWAVCTKELKWADEQEVRMIYYAREGHRITPSAVVGDDGRVKRYVDFPVTARTRMPVQEYIIGPNQDPEEGKAKALRLFSEMRYRNPERKAVTSNAVVVVARREERGA